MAEPTGEDAVMSNYVNPYDQPAHREWVEQGKCGAIHVSKAWCSGDAGHSEDHHAPHRAPDGSVDRHLWWTDQDNHAR